MNNLLQHLAKTLRRCRMATMKKKRVVCQPNIVRAISRNFSLCVRRPLPKAEVEKIYQAMDAEKKKKVQYWKYPEWSHLTRGRNNLDILSAKLRVPGGCGLLFFKFLSCGEWIFSSNLSNWTDLNFPFPAVCGKSEKSALFQRGKRGKLPSKSYTKFRASVCWLPWGTWPMRRATAATILTTAITISTRRWSGPQMADPS